MAVGTNGPPVLNGSAFVYPEKTLAQLRRDLLIRLGYAAMLANPPPGVNDLLNSFLQDAHTQLYTRFPTIRQERWWTIPIVQGSRFYDVPKEGAYLAGNDIAIVNGAPDTITTSTGDFTTAGFTDGMKITITGSDSNDGFHYVAAGGVGPQVLTLTSSATVTNEAEGNQIFVQEDSALQLNMQQIEYAATLDGTQWDEMIAGIDPSQFNEIGQSRPIYYEIREYVEVWPEPNKAYTMYLKGRHSLRPFTADTDITSMDPHPVFLQALATAKAHYGQRDSNLYFQQLENMIGELNAGTFGARRWIPNPQRRMRAAPYPQVTFSRT